MPLICIRMHIHMHSHQLLSVAPIAHTQKMKQEASGSSPLENEGLSIGIKVSVCVHRHACVYSAIGWIATYVVLHEADFVKMEAARI